MTPGSIILDENFKFHDGEKGKKFLIVLGSHGGNLLVSKTTSKGRRYLLDFGCQAQHRFPNFHLVKGCCCLELPTWVCLNEFYIFNYKELLAKHYKQEIFKFGELTQDIYKRLAVCAIDCEDISELQANIIRESLKGSH